MVGIRPALLCASVAFGTILAFFLGYELRDCHNVSLVGLDPLFGSIFLGLPMATAAFAIVYLNGMKLNLMPILLGAVALLPLGFGLGYVTAPSSCLSV